jgi:WD40 repeat protein
LRATEHFQEQITPPAETDIAVFILWSRLGTPLPEEKFQKESGEQYQSGTEWEFENAVEAYQETGTPDLLTYRKTKDPETTLSDEEALQQRIEQKKALESFIDRWFMGEEGTLKAAFHTFETPDEFEHRLEEHLRQLIEERLPERQTEGTSRQARWHKGSPFRGLQAFEYDHAPVFFGRTKAVGEITSALEQKESEGRPFVLVLGPSGSGKSSVVKAGVAPTITQPGVIEGIGLWQRALFRPSDAPEGPVSGLAKALLAEEAVPQLEEYGFDAEELAGLLRDAPVRAANPIERALQEEAEAVADEEGLPEPPESRLLLIVDQMEELFTLDEVGSEERESFARALKAIVENGPVWCIGTMRSDFYPRAAEVETLHTLMQGAGQYALPTPSFAEIGQMIRHPAQAAGLRFEKDPDRGTSLDEVLHEAAADNPEALPLLEFTLEELYQRRDGDVLTFEAYEELGGLEGALAERAEEVYQDLPADAQDAFPDVMEALVTIRDEGDGGVEGAAASRRVPIDDVASDDARETLVDRFVEARLLVTDRNDAGEAVVSVAHEALLREWPRLRDWIERNRAFLQTRARVQERAARWDEEGRPEDLLLPTGQPLAEARGLLEEQEGALGTTLQEYIRQSVERAERRERRRRRTIGGAVAAFVLVVAGFGVFSYQQWTESAERRDQALRSQSLNLAEDAREQVKKGDAMTGMLLALEALPKDMASPDRPYVPKAHSALYNALMHNREQWFVDAHSGPVINSDLGPERRYLVTTSRDSTAQIYDLEKQKLTATLDGHGSTIYHAEFDSTGSRVVTAGGTMAKVWKAPSGKLTQTLDHKDTVLTAHFSPGGGRLLTGVKDSLTEYDRDPALADYQRAHLWSTDGERKRTFGGERVTMKDFEFGPSGERILIAYTDTTAGRPLRPAVVVWNREEKRRTFAPLSQVDSRERFIIQKASFGGEGRWIKIQTQQYERPRGPKVGFIQIPGMDVFSVLDGRGYLSSVNVGSGHERILVSHGYTDSLSVLDIREEGIETVTRENLSVSIAKLGQDGNHIVSQTREGRLKIWPIQGEGETKAYQSRGGFPVRSEVDPSSDRVLSVNRRGVQVWTTDSQPRITQLNPNRVSYQTDENLGFKDQYVAGITDNSEVHLFDLKDPESLDTLASHDAPVSATAFSPDGDLLATADREGSIYLWDTATGEEKAHLEHSERVTGMGVASDGRRLVVSTNPANGIFAATRTPGTIHLWDIGKRKKIFSRRNVSASSFGLRITLDKSRFLLEKWPEKRASNRRVDSVTIEVRSALTGSLEVRIGEERKIRGMAMSGEGPPDNGLRDAGIGPNGRHVFCWGDSLGFVFDLESKEWDGKLSKDGPRNVSFDNRGARFATVSGPRFQSRDQEVPIYDILSLSKPTSLSAPKGKIGSAVEVTHTATFSP